MKRFLSVLLLSALLLSLISCDNSTDSDEDESSALSSATDTTTATEETTVKNTEGSLVTESSGVEETSIETTTPESSVTESDDSEQESTLETSETMTADTETETETETSEEEITMTYEEISIKEASDIDKLLANAVVLKIGYSYALVNGERVEAFDEYTAPGMIGGKTVISLDFVKNNLSLNINAEDVVTNEYGDKFLPLDAITKTYSEYFYDEATGAIALYVGYIPKIDVEYEGNFAYAIVNKLAIGYTVSAQMKGDRPVLTITDEELDFAISKAKSGMDPWASAWKSIETRASKLIGEKPQPDTGASAQAYRLAACKDMINARYLALAYLYSEDEKYLSAAIEYLMAYAEPMLGTDKYLDYSAKTTDGQADIGLNIALPLTTACDTYSLLYTHIGDSDKATIEKWIRAEANLCVKGHKFWIKEEYYGKQYGNNHLTSHLMGIIAAAYVLEDDSLLSYALNSEDNPANLLVMINHAILMEGDDVYGKDTDSDFTPGEIYDRYRVVSTPSNGFGYSLYHLKFLSNTSLMLSNNGIDPFAYYGEKGENILLPYLVYAEYLIQNDSSLGNGHYTGNSLTRESAYSMYTIAYHIYGDSRLGEVIEALESAGVTCTENELFGVTAPFLFAYFPLY